MGAVMSDTLIWTVIALLGVGTYMIRFSFLGIIGDRELPDWVLRHLRYISVGVLPALVAPLVLWPAATEGQFDPPRLFAALAALAVGIVTGRMLLSVFVAMAVLYMGLWLQAGL